MSEFNFGLGNGLTSTRERNRIEKVIKSLDLSERVDFVQVDSAGNGTRYWFAAPNRGNPFDQRLASRVMEAVGHIKTQQRNGKFA